MLLPRRHFLRTLTLAGLGTLLPWGRRLTAAPLAPDPKARWTALLEYARWAPSPHNMQPWAVRVVSATEAELWVEPTRLLRVTDPTSAFMVVALAMFCECLRQAAGAAEYGLDVELASDKPLDYVTRERQLFARLTLAPGADPPLLDRELIRQRRTSRLPYDGRPLDGALRERLTAMAARQGYTLHVSEAPEVVDFVLDLNRETLFSDLDHDADREELMQWIRTTDAEAEARRDGLWYRCMGFRGKLMYNFFHHHERFRARWKRAILGKVYKRSMRGTATVAWLTGPFQAPVDWFAAGTLFQRLWLEMTRAGVYLHPYGSVVTNADAHRRFLEHVGAPADPHHALWLLMRLGHSHEPHRSLRRPVDELLFELT
jgi:nitroreductase